MFKRIVSVLAIVFATILSTGCAVQPMGGMMVPITHNGQRIGMIGGQIVGGGAVVSPQPMIVGGGMPVVQGGGYPAPQQDHAAACMARTGSPAFRQVGPTQVQCLGGGQPQGGGYQMTNWNAQPMYGSGPRNIGGQMIQPPMIMSNPPRPMW